jgi:hypothetical protein
MHADTYASLALILQTVCDAFKVPSDDVTPLLANTDTDMFEGDNDDTYESMLDSQAMRVGEFIYVGRDWHELNTCVYE